MPYSIVVSLLHEDYDTSLRRRRLPSLIRLVSASASVSPIKSMAECRLHSCPPFFLENWQDFVLPIRKTLSAFIMRELSCLFLFRTKTDASFRGHKYPRLASFGNDCTFPFLFYDFSQNSFSPAWLRVRKFSPFFRETAVVSIFPTTFPHRSPSYGTHSCI